MTNGVPIDGVPALPTLLIANQPILSSTFTAQFQGSVLIVVSCNPAAVIQITRNGKGPFAWNAVIGAIGANQEFDLSGPVASGETVNWSFATGTTLNLFEAYYIGEM